MPPAARPGRKAAPPPPGSPGDRLRRLIDAIPESRRPSLREIARRANTDASRLSEILNGRNRNPGVVTLGRILDAIGKTLADYQKAGPGS